MYPRNFKSVGRYKAVFLLLVTACGKGLGTYWFRSASRLWTPVSEPYNFSAAKA